MDGVDVERLEFPAASNLVLSVEEIERHRSRQSCFLTADGKVYDVTAWLDHHPAGAACILRHAGARDSGQDYLFHSEAARRLWRRYQIGVVEGHTSCAIL